MRILESRHKNQFCFLPTIGILYGLSGEYSVRITVMWLSWGISIGIVKNPHYYLEGVPGKGGCPTGSLSRAAGGGMIDV